MESFLALLKTVASPLLKNGASPCFSASTLLSVCFTGHMPEGWQIEHGIAASWESECGGVRQLRILNEFGKPVGVSELIRTGILKGVEVPVGF